MKRREFSRKIARYIRNEIEKLTEEEINQVYRDCASLNQTNCDWLEYKLKEALLLTAKGYLRTLQLRKAADDILKNMDKN